MTIPRPAANALDPREVSAARPTVGILYPGEMGATVGRLLAARGFPVVTTLDGRSPRTAALCRDAGLRVFDSLRDVARTADLVVSLVPPSAAVEVAAQYADARRGCENRTLYLDANSIAPATVAHIAEVLDGDDCALVDASIHGLASRLVDHGMIYLSGPDAAFVGRILGDALPVRVLGEALGTASMFKMLIGGLNKGLVALFLEMGLVACEADLLDEFLGRCRQSYPGVMTVVERLLPTYPQHARRRGAEMTELEQSVRALDLRPGLVREIRRLTVALGDRDLRGGAPDDIPALIERIAADNPLRLSELSCGSVSRTL